MGPMGTAQRSLRAEETTFPLKLASFPLVIERTAPATDKFEPFAAAQSSILESIADRGAILFRGFEIDGPDEFERALSLLGLHPSPDYPFGVSPRPAVTKRIFHSTLYTKIVVISPHNEMAYARYRPRWIAFYCDLAPVQFGETPVFDMALALERLPPVLRDRLLATNMRYVRHIRSKQGLVRLERTLDETFGTSERAEIDKQCAALGVQTEWLGDKCLKATTMIPATVRHPVTRRVCLNAQFIRADAILWGMKRIRERYNRVALALFDRYLNHVFRKPTVPFRSWPEPGPDFTYDEIGTVMSAIYDSATIFRWQRGDLMLIDNIRAAHGRLNVKGPRRILTALGDFYDVRDPATVLESLPRAETQVETIH
jgi:alpha-ketoglutarate-dependent taurine dioxygenase